MKVKKIISITILIFIALYLYNYRQISQVYINKVKLSSKKLKRNFKITQISDFHSNKLVNLDKLFHNISNFNPDIIVLTGDLIDSKTKDLNLALDMVKRAKAITSKIYFVSGNHETNNSLSRNLYNELEKERVIVLDNQIELINQDDDKINIRGVHFYSVESDFKKIFKDIKEEEYNILLSHSPNRPIKYLDPKVDLILSGHTHGGQIRLPILGAVISPGQGLFPKFDKGLFYLGDTILYIDSGLGNSLANLRLFNRIQISNIEISPEG